MTGIALTTFSDLEKFAAMAANSDFVPAAYRGKPANIVLAIQLGSEIGLGPMQSIQNIAVINGKPAVYGDAMLALCRRDRRCLRVTERIVGEGDARTAECVVERAAPDGSVERIGATFSVADAKQAKLWLKRGRNGEDTPWITYPERMLTFRARGFALRDAFPDLLRGLISAEEAADYPITQAPDRVMPPTIDGDATPQPNENPWVVLGSANAPTLNSGEAWEAWWLKTIGTLRAWQPDAALHALEAARECNRGPMLTISAIDAPRAIRVAHALEEAIEAATTAMERPLDENSAGEVV
ncbi:MAG TPA: hypothetical protein VF286_10900 [Acidiphilium sp.]